ncbi:MAG: sulfite exporter TauE/SafE family protein [Saprospiraceae bacterium]|nr:sulfite exporter TauE/SafE family protein [Saprospiraceae bacterium]
MAFTLLILGLAGSLHCMGMCGPLCLIAPVDKSSRNAVLLDTGLYHAGRIFIYMLLGGIIGSIGHLFAISKVQVWLSVLLGILLMLWGLSYYFGSFQQRFLDKLDVNRYFKKIYNRFLQKSSRKNVILLGMANGILPCGLVYSAMAMAFMDGSIPMGAIYMLLFGLATLPLLLVFQLGLGSRQSFMWLKRQNLTPVLFVISGVFVTYKSLSILVPRDASLWSSIVDPILCH